MDKTIQKQKTPLITNKIYNVYPTKLQPDRNERLAPHDLRRRLLFHTSRHC